MQGWIGRQTARSAERPAKTIARTLAAALCLSLAAVPVFAQQDPPPKPLTEEELRAQLIAQFEAAQARQQRLDRIETAQTQLASKRFAEAAAQFNDLIAAEPTPALYFHLGEAQVGLQQFTAAHNSFQQALDLRSRPGGDAIVQPAQRGLGWLAYRDEQYLEALRWWEPLLNAGQRDGELLDLCGRAYYFTQRREAALRCFDAAQLGRPDDRELVRWRIFCAHDVGEDELAYRLARGYLTQTTPANATTAAIAAAADRDRDVRRIAAQCAAALHHEDEAILQLERLNLDAPLASADWLLLGTLYSDKQDDARAAACFEAAYPENSDGKGRELLRADDWLRLAQAQERAGDHKQAADEYRHVLTAVAAASAAPATSTVAWTAAAELGLARMAEADHQFDATVTHAQAALKARPDLGDAHILIAEARELQNKPDEAIAEYQLAAATPACAADAYLGLGRIEYVRDHCTAALRYYQQVQPLRPNDRAVEKIIAQLQERIASDGAISATPVQVAP